MIVYVFSKRGFTKRMKDFFTKKMVKNLIYYALCFLAVIVTPYLAAPIVPLWDWAGYGLMRGMFQEAFTIIFWVLELVGFYIVKRKLDKRAKSKEEVLAETETEEKPKRERKPLLPLRNVLILFAISVVCILIVSIQTGFVVKPIYDIGEKVTGYEILNKVGLLARNVAMCVWILLVLRCSYEIACEALRSLPEQRKKWLKI